MTQDELCDSVKDVIKYVEERDPDGINQALILEAAAHQIKAATQANAMRHALWNALRGGNK